MIRLCECLKRYILQILLTKHEKIIHIFRSLWNFNLLAWDFYVRRKILTKHCTILLHQLFKSFLFSISIFVSINVSLYIILKLTIFPYAYNFDLFNIYLIFILTIKYKSIKSDTSYALQIEQRTEKLRIEFKRKFVKNTIFSLSWAWLNITRQTVSNSIWMNN